MKYRVALVGQGSPVRRRSPATGSVLYSVLIVGFDDKPTPPTPPLTRCFRGVSVVAMRSAWNDPQAVFVVCKGGDNRVNHAHLDLGTFVLDALGERWAIDVGADDYNLPGYFGKER